MIIIVNQLKIYIISYVVLFMENIKQWLKTQWKYDNHPKYQKYFEEWYNNITDIQKQYFQKQKENIENGSLTKWRT